MEEINKYNNMIQSFSADFDLALGGYCLTNLQQLINKKDSKLLKDIQLLSELDFNLRHGKIKIVKA